MLTAEANGITSTANATGIVVVPTTSDIACFQYTLGRNEEVDWKRLSTKLKN